MPSLPTDTIPPQAALLLVELESRQDQVLRELDELNFRIEQAIAASALVVRRENKAA